ncbi:Asp23/Gls24 family envelope stress response protein, partial [Pseudoclavibacter sp. RFBG4]|uniref:Asp23/Gls24 family envelope stress response protein n=1 Tax=Pseudoclavibacter sp. RFBG4 TaxID=2080575 RepID=UPI000D4612B5
MANTTPNTTSAHGTAQTSGSVVPTTSNGRGTTTIVDSVVARVAGIAAREARGVYDLGGGAARAIGAIRNALNANDQGQGISVEV